MKAATKVLILLLATFGLSVAPGVAADSSASDRWSFDLDVYVWLPTFEGKLKYDIPGTGDTLEVDPGQILEDLQFVGMMSFAARKDRWSAFTDVIYLDMSGSNSSSVPISIGSGAELNVGAGFELQGWVIGVGGARDVIQTDRARLGILFGGRYLSADTDIAIRVDGPLPPQLPTGEYSQRGELLNGIVGVRGHYGRKWYVPYYLDLGTGDSDLTWQAMTGFGYRWHWGSAFLVYRHLSFEQGADEFIREMSLSGPALGVKFRF